MTADDTATVDKVQGRIGVPDTSIWLLYTGGIPFTCGLLGGCDADYDGGRAAYATVRGFCRQAQ